MKTMGLIGGMSWKSSLEYYGIVNETIKDRLGGFHSAKCILYSFDFEHIERLQHAGEWPELAEMMIDAAQTLERAGAEFIVICANTMHKFFDDVRKNVKIPLIHIADATAEKILQKGLKKVGLLGTRFTMEQGFYKERMIEKFGIEVIIPKIQSREAVHAVVYDELCLGILKQSSKKKIESIIDELISNGAEGIVLGCTEIPLLIAQDDVSVPVFSTTEIHAKAACDFALKT